MSDPAPAPSASPGTRALTKWLPGVMLGLGLILGWWWLSGNAAWGRALAWIQDRGAWGMVVFVVIYVVACVFLLPGSALTLGAGAIYGVVTGTLLVSLASTLGATAAFLVGRYLLRERVAGWVARQPKFAAMDRAVAADSWKIVLLTRLSPVIPFAPLNYALGLTRVPWHVYVIGSWLGMLPGTVLYVYLGSLAHAGGGPGRRPIQWLGYGVGLMATLAVTWVLARLARRALQPVLDDPAAKS